jgi:LysM repeat protein
MRTWTKSACVMLAWSILPIILIAIGSTGSVHPAHASARTASSTEVTLISLQSAPAAPVTTARPPVTKYVVQSGDTLSSIAARFAVHGGWPALYAANRRAVGPDPDTIRPGTVLRLPSRALPARYTVAPGDTLSGIAARLALPGGWLALYEANWQAVGPDPNTIRPGTVLTIPSPAASTSPSSRPGPATRPRPASRPHPATKPRPASPPPAPAGSAHHAAPRTLRAADLSGMPAWLKALLLAVALLIGLTFLAEALMTLRRQHAGGDAAAGSPVSAGRPPGAVPPSPERPAIVLADHDRLVVTCDKQAARVFVLRPPGEDPRVILRVARLVLPEGPYGELAKQLGVPAVGSVE